MKKKTLGAVLASLLLALALSLSLVGCDAGPTPDPTPDGTLTESGEEAGVYYFDPGYGDEYVLTLGGSCTYTLAVKGAAQSGTYTLTDGSLSMKLGETELYTAAYDGSSVTLTYENAQLRFLKKVYYTVTFDVKGGSAAEALTVLNGKTVGTAPVPTKDGYVFLGWYADEALTTPFAFNGTPVTANLTLYARYAAKPADAVEHTVSFDLGYNGQTLADMETIGGKLYDAPVPTREGYTFLGWWLSDTETADRLTARFVAPSDNGGTVFTADTTLFAVWQDASQATATPSVSVSDKAVSWDSVGSAAYLITITSPDGTVITDAQRTTSTTFPVSFTMAGAYKVEVVAVDAGGNAVSDTAVRYFTNLALDRILGLTVADGSVLVWNSVEGAEKYTVTVQCGNADHVHTAFDNGTACFFNFSRCDMKKGGIVFTVTASAKGRASSVATLTYERTLPAANGLAVSDGVLTWDDVVGATYYEVNVGKTVYYVLGTSLDLSALTDGSYELSVTPVTHGYNATATTLTYAKGTPALPENVRLVGTLLTWDAVTGATSYEVKLGARTLTVEAGATEVDLAAADADFADGASYTLSLTVNTADASATKTVTLCYNDMPDAPVYRAGVLTWTPVIGADSYDVEVGDEVVNMANGDCFYRVGSLAAEGKNVLRVRFHSGSFVSEWKETAVTAYAVMLDSRGGTETDTLYLAIGDPISLPSPEKDGYEFVAWYDLPSGAAAGGALFSDPIFVGSGEKLLYAYYTPKTYDVILSDGDDVDETVSIPFGNHFTLKVPTAANATTSFGGWYSAPYGAGIAYTDAEGNSLAPWTYTDNNVKLYAFWVDGVLSFDRIGNGYAVSAGDRIGLVSTVKIPAEYNGLPVTTIVGNAFADCDTLVELQLPDTLTDIAVKTAFSGCSSLASVEVYATGASSARYSSADGVLFDRGTADARHALRPAFLPAAKSGVYTVPYGVDVIPERAFAGSGLTKVVLPVTVKEIGKEAFAECASLVSVVFENVGMTSGVEGLTIGESAFFKCEELTSIVLPARLKSIALTRFVIKDGEITSTASGNGPATANAFEGCYQLTDVSVARGHGASFSSENGVLLGENGTALLYFPQAKSAENYVIPDGVTKIASGAFFGVKGLSGSLSMPARLREIGTAAFYSCSGVTSLTFEGGVSALGLTVGDYAFAQTKIASLTFAPESKVTAIGQYAFNVNLSYSQPEREKTLVLPASLTSVGDYAFYGYGKLAVTIEGGSSTLTLGKSVFGECEITRLALPKNVAAMPSFFLDLTVGEIEVDPENETLMSLDGVLYAKENGNPVTLLLYPSAKEGTSYEIPNTVTAIADGAFMNGNLTSVTIPSSVKTIGDYAFYYSGLTSVTIPSSVTSIGDYAFYYASYSPLTSLTFEAGGAEPLTIGDYAFYCVKITSLSLPERAESIGASSFYRLQKLTEISLGGVKHIGEFAFYNCSFAGVLTIPASVETLGTNAFSKAKFSQVAFESGSKLTAIGAGAFKACGFTSFNVPASVTEIAAEAFAECENLISLTFDEGDAPLTFGAGDYAVLRSTSSLTSITLPARLTAIGENAFADTAITEVLFAENCRLTEIGKSAFASCSSLTSITLPSSLVTIGESAFQNARLESIAIPASVKNTDAAMGIGAYAFDGCPLGSVTFAAGGTEPLTIGENAFSVYYSWQVKVWSDTYTDDCYYYDYSTGRYYGYVDAYSEEDYLTSVTLPARLAPFTDADGKTVAPLANGVKVFSYQLAEIAVEAGSGTYYTAHGGVLYNADATELVFCPPAKTGEVVIPATVKKLPDGAFYPDSLFACTDITSITFAEGSVCEEIGAQAFYKSKALTTLVLPNSVKRIGASAFEMCYSLTSLTLPAGLTEFDPSIVSYCTGLTELAIGEGSQSFKVVDSVLFTVDGKELLYYLPTATATTYTVPEGITVIGASAFNKNSALSEVILPSTLTHVGDHAFSGCRSLDTVTFTDGTAELVLDDYAFASTALSALTLPARVLAIGDYVFNYSALETLSFAQGSKLSYIGEGAFMDSSLSMVTLPQSLREIGAYAFSGTSLVSVTLPEGLLQTGEHLFEGTDTLQSVSLPSTLTLLGNFAFRDCSSLQTVNFAKNSKLTTLYVGTFKGCESLTSIELPASLLEIPDRSDELPQYETGDGLFSECESLVNVTFADGSLCRKIGAYAFAETQLATFKIPASVTEIGAYAFTESALVSIVIPNTVTTLGEGAFDWCESLNSVTLGNGVRTLSDRVFANTALTQITLPAAVTEIASGAFSGCDGIVFTLEEGTALHLVDGVLYDADWSLSFFPSGKTEWQIPKDFTTLPDGFFGYWGDGADLESITVEEGNTAFVEENGVLFNAAKTEVIFFADTVTEFTLTGALLADADKADELLEALAELSALTEIKLGEGMDKFGYRVVGGVLYDEYDDILVLPAGLTEWVIPKWLETVPGYLFYYNTNIRTVTSEVRGEDDPELVIEDYAFSYASNLTSVSLPANLTEIGGRAFRGCSGLATLTIADSSKVSDIGYRAFQSCSGLTTLNLGKISDDFDFSEFETYCTNLQTVTVEATESYKSEDGIVYKYNGTEWVEYFRPAKWTATSEA